MSSLLDGDPLRTDTAEKYSCYKISPRNDPKLVISFFQKHTIHRVEQRSSKKELTCIITGAPPAQTDQTARIQKFLFHEHEKPSPKSTFLSVALTPTTSFSFPRRRSSGLYIDIRRTIDSFLSILKDRLKNIIKQKKQSIYVCFSSFEKLKIKKNSRKLKVA